MSQITLGRPVQAPKNKSGKKGCVFGCLGTIIGVPILLVLIGWYIVMHTAVPFRLAAKAIEEDPNISIEGIGGSISKGFTIDTLRYTDDQGNKSVLEGLTLMWGDINRMRKHRELVIEEIGLRRAHIIVDTDDSASESSESSSGSAAKSGDPLKLFEIKKIDIRELLVETVSGDFKLELDAFLMEGLRIEGDDFSLGSLSVGSNLVDLDVENAAPAIIEGTEVPFTRRIVGTLKPGIHKSIAGEIDFAIELGSIGGEMVHRVRGLGGTVNVVSLGKGGLEMLTVRDLNPADYFAEEFAGPVSGVSLRFRSGDPDPASGKRPGLLEGGSFTLGATPFTVAPRTVTDDTTKSDATPLPIVGTAKVGEVEVTASLNESAGPATFFRVELSSKPNRGQQDIIALLWFGKPLAELTPMEVAKVAAINKQSFSETAEKAP